MRGLALEGELGADQRVVLQPEARAQRVADVDDDRGVRVLEVAGAHEIRPADELLLGRSERDRHRAREPMTLHDLLHRMSGAHRDGAHRVVPFHVAGRSRHERLALDDVRGLRAFGQRVDLCGDDDEGLARSPRRPHVRGHAGPAELDGEPDALERLLEELRALELLHPQLAEVEERVTDEGDLLRVPLDGLEGLLLRLGRRRRGDELRQEGACDQSDGERARAEPHRILLRHHRDGAAKISRVAS